MLAASQQLQQLLDGLPECDGFFGSCGEANGKRLGCAGAHIERFELKGHDPATSPIPGWMNLMESAELKAAAVKGRLVELVVALRSHHEFDDTIKPKHAEWFPRATI